MASITVFATNLSTQETSVGSIGWNSRFAVQSDNGLYTSSANSESAKITYYLLCPPASLAAIPSGSTIDGIAVEIERKEQNSAAAVTDEHVRLYKNGTGFVGNDKADTGTGWTTSDVVVTYGGSSDLWGTTWTRDEVVDDLRFGISIDVGNSSWAGQIDYVEFTIYYTESAQTVTAPLITATGLNASSSIDRNVGVTAPLLTASGTIASVSIDRNISIAGTLLTATGGIPSDSILTGFVINAPLLTATGIQSPSLSYDQALTAPLLTATGSNASAFTYDQFVTGALLTASSYIAGNITYNQFITAILVQASGINLPTFTFTQLITAILLEASGLIPADTVKNLWTAVETPASNTWSDVEHDEDTLSWTDVEFKG